MTDAEAARSERVPTAMGQPLRLAQRSKEGVITSGAPPIVFQAQSFGFIRIEGPEQLKQWESDVRAFYGIDVDASALAGHACETCSAGCSDDCGMLA